MKKKMSTSKKVLIAFAGTFGALVLFGACAAAIDEVLNEEEFSSSENGQEVVEKVEPVEEEVEDVVEDVEEEVEDIVEEEPEEELEEEPEEEPEEEMTLSQKNAIKKAESYISFTAFSYKGLIEQLEFEGFSKEDATFGVENINVNWYEQAVLKGESYLDFTSFSRSGLIDQLKFEGFTEDQAVHAVNEIGL